MGRSLANKVRVPPSRKGSFVEVLAGTRGSSIFKNIASLISEVGCAEQAHLFERMRQAEADDAHAPAQLLMGSLTGNFLAN